MNVQQIEALVVKTLEDGKARDIQVMNIEGISTFTDRMIVASGTSTTHVKSNGNAVAQAFKDIDEPPLGVETTQDPQWVLIDLGDVVVHVMTESAREHYQLEKLWEKKPERAEVSED